MGNRQVAGRCAQNSAVPLICPLDIQGACESSVFGDIIKKSESTSNTGLLNFNWKAQIEGSSLLLGLFLGVLLTLIVQGLIMYIRSRRRQGKLLRGISMQMPWWSQPHNNQLQHQPMIPASPIAPAAPAAPPALVMSPQVNFTPQPQQQQMTLAPPLRLYKH